MSYEFKKLSEVEALTEVPEGATVLAEVGGAIKRIPGEGLGGGGGVGLIVETTNPYDMSTATANMTLTEALEKLRAKELLSGALYISADEMSGVCSFSMIADNSVSAGANEIMLVAVMGSDYMQITWTAEGFFM